MLKKIFKDSFANLKKNWVMSVMLCLIIVLSSFLIVAVSSVPFLSGTLIVILLLCFVLCPLVFALQTMHFGLRENAQPSGKLFFRFFRAYFSPGIMGVYRVINTILFSVLAEMLTGFAIFGIVNIIATVNPDYANTITMLMEAMGEQNFELLESLMETPEVKSLMFIHVTPSLGVGILVCFLSASFNSMSIYFKVKNPLVNPAYSARIYLLVKNRIRGQLIKEYWGLNWPIYVLFALGYAGGICIGFYSFEELLPEVAMIIGLALGFGLSLIYLPFFINNLESIYLAHHEQFAQGPQAFAEKMQEAMSQQMDAMQQQMEDLARQQQDLQNKQNQTDDNNDNNNSDVINNNEASPIDTADNNNVVDADVKDDENKDNQ